MTREFSPESIYEIARNFMQSRILLTGVELNLFSLLSVEPLTAQEITSRLESDLRATTIVLDALPLVQDPASAPLLLPYGHLPLVPTNYKPRLN